MITESSYMPALTQLRPRSVTVFGVLNIILGSLGVLYPLPAIWAIVSGHGIRGATLQIQAVIIITTIGMVALGVWAICTGMGLLKLRGWARKGGIVSGWILSIYGMMLAIGYVTAIIAYATRIDEVGANNLVRLLMIGMIMLFLTLIYPVLFVVFMSKPKAVAACNR